MSDSKYTVYVRATSIKVVPGSEAMYPLDHLIELLTYDDEFTEETKFLGYIYDSDEDALYFHKGVDLNYLRKTLGDVTFKDDSFHPFKPMKFRYEEIVAPRNDEQVDVINFIAGLREHGENLDKRQLFLVKKPGFGKAQPYSTRIPTPMRRTVKSTIMKFIGKELKTVPIEYTENIDYIKMGDLKVGDYVFDRFGKPTVVTNIFEQGEKDVYKITFEDGRTALCCYEHLWGVFVDDNPKYNVYDTSEMIDMLKQDKTLSIPLCRPAEYSDKPYVCYECETPMETIYHNMKDSYLCSSPDTIMKVLYGHGLKEFTEPGKEYKMMIPDETFANDIFLPLLYQMGYKAYYKDGIIYYSNQCHLKITSIEYSHREECRCIMVDNPYHMYLTEDFIVTHNTFCAGVGLCLYGVRTLIIMHRDNLRGQWLNSLYNMSGLGKKDVHEITSSEEVYNIATGNIQLNYDVYLMTHATFRAGLKRISNLKIAQNISKNLGIGMKIIDEAHLEFRDTITMDCVFNVKRNLYLTATDGRSAKEENAIFRHVFANTLYYKPSSLLSDNIPKKWVHYVAVAVNTHVKTTTYKYRIVGGRGMNAPIYGRWVIKNDKNNTHFKCCTELIRQLYQEDEHAKVLLFMPLIELCEECAYWINKHLSYDKDFQYDLSIKTINSSNSKSENEMNKRADVIVTTIQSAGTGTDIPGITDIICCSPYCSRITAEQVMGRIRYIPKKCHYYDIYDTSVQMDIFWLMSRIKKFKTIAASVNYLTFDE